MAEGTWTEEATARALQHWASYLSSHEIVDRLGQTVGIEPQGGRVWFGSTASEVARNRDEDGVHSPMHFLRVGRDFYLRK